MQAVAPLIVYPAAHEIKQQPTGMPRKDAEEVDDMKRKTFMVYIMEMCTIFMLYMMKLFIFMLLTWAIIEESEVASKIKRAKYSLKRTK